MAFEETVLIQSSGRLEALEVGKRRVGWGALKSCKACCRDHQRLLVANEGDQHTIRRNLCGCIQPDSSTRQINSSDDMVEQRG